jgi:hypothetical protein
MKYYRYQTINKQTILNLNNQRNWVADPLQFNDPYEFSLFEHEYQDDVGDIIRMNSEEIEVVNNYKEKIKDLGVICYSSNQCNLLLWAHYADNHNGMCLVFDVDNTKEKLYNISYQDRFPDVDLTGDSEDYVEIIKIVTTKSADWKYEQEYRQVFIMKNILYEYPGKLVEIIFGCRTPFDDIKMVSNIAVSKNPGILISKMIMERNYYHLIKETAEINTEIPINWKLKLKI